MKTFRKFLPFLFFTLLLVMIGYIILNWHNDRPLESLKEKYLYPESRFMELQGMQVHYRIVGQGEPLVLLHGTAASLHTWEAWTDILSKDFRIISMDLPAFGLTGPHPQRKYDMESYSSFLHAFVKEIGLDSFYIAGNSLGGRICWNYAFRYPEQVRKMILLDASGYPSDKAPPLAIRLGRSNILGPLLTKLTPKALHRKSLLDVYGNDALLTDETVDRYFELMLRPGNRQAFVDRTRLIYEDTSAQIKTIKAPTLIQWGSEDLWVSPKHARQFHEDISGSELKIYEGAGHIPMEEIPEETAGDARDFLLKG